ncbi:zinc finger BED domain-containing protein DAYSLEEPER-like [Nicotiana tomentosiformis]|uniref:zinc finger BED domain-containing protein DAYSLEEPER-like n=1 Tax=Nicotiana tomentosiformis TaxID=4098 RepID=UPI00388CBDEA
MTELEVEKGNEFQIILKDTESGASNNPTTNTLHCESASKKRKGMKERSVAWGHFDKFTDDEGIKKAKCKYCQDEYVANTKNRGTSNLLSYMIKCPNNPHKVDTSQPRLAFQPKKGGQTGDVSVAAVYEDAFTKYYDIDYGLMHCISNCICEDGQPAGPLLSSDWESSSLKELMKNEDVAVREIAKNMKEKFDKYWGDPHKMNKMVFILCVLDPRHEFYSFSFALTSMFGETKGVKIQEEVKTYMKTLFSEYVKMNGDSFLSSPSPPSSPSSCSSSSSFSKFMLDLKRHKSGGGIDLKTELDKYLGEDVEEEKDKFDVLGWWKLNSPRFPTLANMARDMLAIPIFSVASESVFSTGGRILDPFRSSLTPRLVQALVCIQD